VKTPALLFSRVIRPSLLCLLFWSFALAAEPVEIPGPTGPLEAELLAVPDATDVVVVIPGSGPTDRDGNSPTFGMTPNSYRMLAEDLAAAGVASLRIDKRGFFGSETAIADPNDVTIGAYASDARDWVARASDVAPCVWLAGHSEGVLVALVAASEQPDALCGVILLATPGRPVGQLLIERFANNPANGPYMAELESLVADLENGRTRDPATIAAPLRPLFSEGLQRYMTDLFSYDPAQVAAGLDRPALVVQGDADIQVMPEDAALLLGGLPQGQEATLSGGTHMLKADAPGDPLRTYRDPDLPLHPDLIPAIIGFLDEH